MCFQWLQKFVSSNDAVAGELGIFLRKLDNFDPIKLGFFIFFLNFNFHRSHIEKSEVEIHLIDHYLDEIE